MLITFKTKDLEDLYKLPINDLGKQKVSKAVIISYRKRLEIIGYANNLGDISKLRGMNLEKLRSKEYKDCFSVRVNDQYRIIFKELKGGQVQILVMELSKHYE
jgi:plasmid maintenance system killer protein